MNALETKNFDRIAPQHCINAKIRRLHRLLNNVYQAKIKPFGLKGSMLSILFLIGKRPKINQKTIADELVLDQSTISRDLKKLQKKGWVTIYKGDDPRYSELMISEAGYALLEEVSPIWEETHQKVQDILGTFSIQQIDNITTAVHNNLDQLKA